MSFTYAGQIGPFVAQDSAGNVQPAAVVTLRDATNSTDAVAYVDRDRSDVMDNPLTLTADGVLTCWAEPGVYVLRTVVGEDTKTQTVTVYPDPSELTLDPATYLSDFGEGFVLESEAGGFDIPLLEVRWDVVHPINGVAGIDAVEGEFPEDLSVDPPFGYSIRSAGINHPGLYIVEWKIAWDTFTSDAGSEGYSVQVELPSSDSRLHIYLPDDDREVYGHFVTWLPETNVRLKIAGMDWDTAVLQSAFLRLAPLFTLPGVEPS